MASLADRGNTMDYIGIVKQSTRQLLGIPALAIHYYSEEDTGYAPASRGQDNVIETSKVAPPLTDGKEIKLMLRLLGIMSDLRHHC